MTNHDSLYHPETDPEFQRPFIDIDEWRDSKIRHRYVHGGFEGSTTCFSFYFPEPASFQGRFYHFMSPVQGHEDASQELEGTEDRIHFALANGSYFVESNMGGFTLPGMSDGQLVFRASAASAEYSRVIAQAMYHCARPFGYIFGGSGGGFKTMSCFENTDHVWDGAVPFVPGTPMSIPCSFTVRAHAMRILRDRLVQIVDDLAPGGRDNLTDGFNAEEREAWEEVTRFGFPPYAWAARKWMGTGALPILAPIVETIDPGYFKDFWSLPGYLGTVAGGSAQRDRVQFKAMVTRVHAPELAVTESVSGKTGVDDAWHKLLSHAHADFRPYLELSATPPAGTYLEGAKIIISSGLSSGIRLELDRVEDRRVYIGFGLDLKGILKKMSGIEVGDEVVLDNSDFIAIQTYHRHQVPPVGYPAWNQFRDEADQPIFPQRPLLVGPLIAQGGAGSLQSGLFQGKMIVVAALSDESALPWQADWYRQLVNEVSSIDEAEHYRLWYIDKALHADTEQSTGESCFASYLGALYQALLSVSDWVERGLDPALTTKYQIVESQLQLPASAHERKGIQPIVSLKANGEIKATINAGEMVSFEAFIEMPEDRGQIEQAMFFAADPTGSSFETELNFHNDHKTAAQTQFSYVYIQSGTYFPIIRVFSNQRAGDRFTQIENLARVRVVVE